MVKSQNVTFSCRDYCSTCKIEFQSVRAACTSFCKTNENLKFFSKLSFTYYFGSVKIHFT